MLECERCAMGVDRVLSFADALWPSFLTARGTALGRGSGQDVRHVSALERVGGEHGEGAASGSGTSPHVIEVKRAVSE